MSRFQRIFLVGSYLPAPLMLEGEKAILSILISLELLSIHQSRLESPFYRQ